MSISECSKSQCLSYAALSTNILLQSLALHFLVGSARDWEYFQWQQLFSIKHRKLKRTYCELEESPSSMPSSDRLVGNIPARRFPARVRRVFAGIFNIVFLLFTSFESKSIYEEIGNDTRQSLQKPNIFFTHKQDKNFDFFNFLARFLNRRGVL